MASSVRLSASRPITRILEQLDLQREVFGRWRNLVVAATGTGKTLVAAFDYRRLTWDEVQKPVV